MVTFQHCDELGYSIPKNYSIKLETIVATIKIGFSFFLLIVYFDFFLFFSGPYFAWKLMGKILENRTTTTYYWRSVLLVQAFSTSMKHFFNSFSKKVRICIASPLNSSGSNSTVAHF